MAINFSVSDAEEADKLAFNLTASGITLISAGAGRSLVDGIADRAQHEKKHKKGDPLVRRSPIKPILYGPCLISADIISHPIAYA